MSFKWKERKMKFIILSVDFTAHLLSLESFWIEISSPEFFIFIFFCFPSISRLIVEGKSLIHREDR